MKLTARTVAAITAITLSHLLTMSVQAQTWSVPVYGCLQGTRKTAEIKLKDVLVRTDNPYLDDLFQTEIDELNERFGVGVAVYFPNDNLNEAFFTPRQHADLITRDDGDPSVALTGSVFISVGFVNREADENCGCLLPVIATMAHEFAHAMQYRNNFPYEGIWKEQHADFMAGWFIAHRGRFIEQEPEVAFASFYRKGDNKGFFDPKHHGSGEDRVSAMIAGYNYNLWKDDGSAMNAYSEALRGLRAAGAK